MPHAAMDLERLRLDCDADVSDDGDWRLVR